MHWMDACRVSPYGRATLISRDKKIPNDSYILTRTLDGKARIYMFRLGFWAETDRVDLIEGRYDWEPEGIENGLDKARYIAYNKKRRGKNAEKL